MSQPAPAGDLIPAGCRAETSFLGFSSNQQAAAELVVVTCAKGRGSEERLSYARIYSVEAGDVRGTFRASVPERREHGQLVAKAPAAWQRDYGAYRAALPLTTWRRLAKQAAFAAQQYDFSEDVVRLRPIEASVAHAHSKQKVVQLESPDGRPLQFVVVVRTLAGHLDDTLVVHTNVSRANLRVYYTRDGRRIAALLTSGARHTQLLLPSRPLLDPLDLPIGAVPLMQWDAAHAYQNFRDLLPAHDARAAEMARDAFRM